MGTIPEQHRNRIHRLGATYTPLRVPLPGRPAFCMEGPSAQALPCRSLPVKGSPSSSPHTLVPSSLAVTVITCICPRAAPCTRSGLSAPHGQRLHLLLTAVPRPPSRHRQTPGPTEALNNSLSPAFRREKGMTATLRTAGGGGRCQPKSSTSPTHLLPQRGDTPLRPDQTRADSILPGSGRHSEPATDTPSPSPLTALTPIAPSRCGKFRSRCKENSQM